MLRVQFVNGILSIINSQLNIDDSVKFCRLYDSCTMIFSYVQFFHDVEQFQQYLTVYCALDNLASFNGEYLDYVGHSG